MKLKRDSAITAAAVAGENRDALFGVSKDFPRLIEAKVDEVHPRADQPRRTFDDAALLELADSISRHGLLQPIIVRKRGEGGYEILAGERRWRAHRLMGRPTIFAIVATGDADEVALIENLQRVDLAPLEAASGLQRLIQRHGYTQEQLAATLGKSRFYVTEMLRLLDLPDEIRSQVECGMSHIPASTLLQVARESNPDVQRKLWDAAKGGASVKELKERRAGKATSDSPKPVSNASQVGQFFRDLLRIERSTQLDVEQVRSALDDEKRRRLQALRDRLDRILSDR